jgi:hypothetical protein
MPSTLCPSLPHLQKKKCLRYIYSGRGFGLTVIEHVPQLEDVWRIGCIVPHILDLDTK